jgi:hypothetical protein
MSDNRNDSIIGRDERDRQAQFGNAEDTNRHDTQNTREDLGGDAEFGDAAQTEGERGTSDIEDEGEDAFGNERDEDQKADRDNAFGARDD